MRRANPADGILARRGRMHARTRMSSVDDSGTTGGSIRVAGSAPTPRGARASASNCGAAAVQRHVDDTCVEECPGAVHLIARSSGMVAMPSHQPSSGPGEPATAWAVGASVFAGASLGTAIGAGTVPRRPEQRFSDCLVVPRVSSSSDEVGEGRW